MKIITSVKIVMNDEIIEVADFIKDEQGHLEVEVIDGGDLNDVLDRIEEMCAFVRKNM